MSAQVFLIHLYLQVFTVALKTVFPVCLNIIHIYDIVIGGPVSAGVKMWGAYQNSYSDVKVHVFKIF